MHIRVCVSFDHKLFDRLTEYLKVNEDKTRSGLLSVILKNYLDNVDPPEYLICKDLDGELLDESKWTYHDRKTFQVIPSPKNQKIGKDEK